VTAMDRSPTLHMFCGKIGSGKSTLAAQLGAAASTVLMSEDQLLANLYPGEIVTIQDYARCSDRLRRTIGPHIIDLLRNGMSVVLDFQANTTAVRAWMRKLIDEAECNHQLHLLRTPEPICRERLAARNARGDHEYQVSEADFDLFSSYFVAPEMDEGFTIVHHG
jgi:predicted kinase